MVISPICLGICTRTGKFMFWKVYDSTSEIMGKNVEDLLQKVKLDGKSIMEVWDLIEINCVF
jgi:hypothetical protein